MNRSGPLIKTRHLDTVSDSLYSVSGHRVVSLPAHRTSSTFSVLHTAAPVAARTHAEAGRFFAGLGLVEPGLVQVHRWRPGAGDAGRDRNLAINAGVGRKP